MRTAAPRKSSHLFYKLSLPMLGMIVVFISLFTTVSSYILIRVQNDHTLKMAEQSMKFVYRNVWYQFDTMRNVSAFVLSNQFIDNLVNHEYENDYEAIGDFFDLQTNLENLSLLSLLHDFVPNNLAQTTYTVSMALEPTSSLYKVAPAHFFLGTGISQAADLRGQIWFERLGSNENGSVWWGQSYGAENMIYTASRKLGHKDGRNLGTVIIGADTRSIRGVIGNAPIDKGYYLLLDDRNRVIYSDRHRFMEDLSGSDYTRLIQGSSGTIKTGIDNEAFRIMYDSFDNGWRLLAVVPESHFTRYTFAISALGAAIGAISLLISGFWLRSIVVRVTVPISRLINAMQRREVLEFQEPLPGYASGIYEVDELNQKFSSMLVIIHQLIEKSFTEEIERRQLQLELLQAQINPHFLYNTLDLINCRALISGDKETSLIVRSLANVFRYGLNKGKTWIPLQDEIRQVEAYLDIQKMMLDDLSVDIEVPDELMAVSVVHLILQPLAENSIVHGFADKTSGCRIVISARKERNCLVLRVEDNGKGADPELLNRRLAGASQEEAAGDNGYGTLNVHRRIRLHCKGDYGLRYMEVPSGTCVEAVLPLQREMIASSADEGDRYEEGR